jgi:uncharacterized membrane protein
MKKKILYALLIAFIAIQFIHPTQNKSCKASLLHISKVFGVPQNVNAIFTKACNDCHSNNTFYPWYANMQPSAWWLNNHVHEGKDEINFDEFGTYSLRRMYKKLSEIKTQVAEEKEMPLDSYTWMHAEAKLTDAERKIIGEWANGLQDSLKKVYPLDSLIKNSKK